MPTITTEITEQEQNIIQAVSKTINHLQEQHDAGEATFNVESKLDKGFQAEVNVRELQFISDEPENLGGDNAGPNPVEYVLGALAACQELVIKAHAGQLGINVKSVEVNVKGDIDLKGFFNVSDVRPGFQNISYQTVIKTDEDDPEKLQQLKDISLKNCPVLDIIQNPTPVKGDVSFAG